MDTVSMLNKMSFYCQPILPLVYDESMSYYETLCKVVGQLNTTGETVNKLNEGLTGEIADRQAADSELDERLKLVEATNDKIHFLVFDGANPNGGFPTRDELYQWVNEGDAIFTLFRTNEEGRGQIYAASCSYNAGNWVSEASNDFSIIVPIETSYDATRDYAVKQKVAKLTIPHIPQTNLNVPWGLQIIEVNTPYTSAEGVVNLVAVINDSDSVNCSITPSEFLGIYNTTRSGKNLCVAVNAKLSYDGLARSSSVATVDTNNRKIRIAFERDGGVYTENGVKQLNKTLDYIIGDASTNVWTHETIDSKTLDFSRYEGFQFTRGAHNVITTDDESTPNAVYTQYHANSSGKLYQNLPTRLIDTVDNAEYWNGVFDIKDGNHMTFTFVASNYATASDKMLVRVIELSANVNTTAWKYAEKEFELPISASGEKEDFVVTITPLSPSDVPTSVDAGIAQFTAACDKTFAEIKGAIDAGKNVLGNYNGNIWPLSRATDTMIAIDGTINLGYFGDTSNATCSFVIQSNGIATITCAAGELPAPSSDGSDNGKVPTVNGTRWEMKKAVVDDALSGTSTNPVQNKAVTNALAGKASTAVASRTANGLMSSSDYIKLLGIEDGATNTVVDAELNANSTNPVQNKAVKTALDGKASTEVASETANGLMSALDKKKLNGIEDGANKTIVDEMLSDGSTNPVQNKAVTAALDSVVRETIYPIAVTATSADWTVTNGIAYKEASADRTFDDIKAAYNGNKTLACEFERMTYSLILDSPTAFIFASYRGAVANDSQYAGLGKYPTSLITINTTGVVISRTAGDLPAVDGTDNDKMLIVSGGEWALQRVAGTTVDAELSTTSENPVQNKTVTAALNDKLPKTGGTVTGALRTNDSFSAGGTIAFGEAPIGLSQTADGAAEIRYGSADVNDNPPQLSRLKVARPTEDDDAATKAYVDGKTVAPIFTSPVMIRKEAATDSAGVYLSTVGIGEKSAEIMLEDVNENAPVAISNLRTPTGAGADNYAATKGYVDSKVASSGSSDFVVNVTVSSDMTATLDKTFNQIQAAIQDGKQPVVKWSNSGSVGIMPMVGYNKNSVSFMAGTHVDEHFIGSQFLSITSAGTVRFYIANAASISDSGIMQQVNMAFDPISPMQIATKKYVDDHLSGAPITIKLGTGNAATSTATFAEIKAALEAGKAPILDSAPGTSHWFALNWTLSGSGSLSIQYGTFNVEGGGMANFTLYNVSVSSTGITYSSSQFTTE